MGARPPRFLALVLAGLIALQPAATLACALPDGVAISAADAQRLEGFAASRSQGLAEALVAEAAADRALVSRLFSRGDGAPDTIADGDYRCRTIKLGGLLPLTAYGFFDCTIAKGGTRIEKTSGSQRFSGLLRPTDGALVYRGALHYGDGQPMAYDADPERNQVGCLYAVPDGTDGHYRLELPSPLFESTHDVIELVRVD